MSNPHAGSQGDRLEQRSDAWVKALVLLCLSLGLLLGGNFIQFDDTSGFGSNEWVMPFAPLALLAACGSLAVAVPDLFARRMLGAALLLLDAVVAWQVMTNDGFRFIWSHDEGELFQLQLALAIAGLALMTKSVYRTTEPTGSAPATEPGGGTPRTLVMTGWARFVAYLGATVVLVFVAFFMGVAHFEATECSGPDFGGECDLAVLGGFAWSAAVILLALVAIPTIEIVLLANRRRRG